MIVHICSRDAWSNARTAGTYEAESLASPSIGEDFPHLYGPLPVSAVTELLPLEQALARAAER